MPRLIRFTPLLLLMLLAWQQVASVGIDSDWGIDLQNALHMPWFATLTLLLVLWSRQWRVTDRMRWCIVVVAMLAGAGGSEIVQSFTGRDAELQDCARDLLGGGAALLGYRAVCVSGRQRWLAVAGACLLVAIGLATLVRSSAVLIARPLIAPVLFDPAGYFSRTFATPIVAEAVRGAPADSWRLRLLAGRWQGFELPQPYTDWRPYARLCLRLGVADNQPLALLVRIHDGAHSASGNAYNDRFNRHITLTPGVHLVDIDLADVAHGPQWRRLNMAAIANLGVYQLPPSTAGRLLDAGPIWLTRAPHCE